MDMSVPSLDRATKHPFIAVKKKPVCNRKPLIVRDLTQSTRYSNTTWNNCTLNHPLPLKSFPRTNYAAFFNETAP